MHVVQKFMAVISALSVAGACGSAEEECDPAAEALESLAVQEAVAEGEWTPTEAEAGWSASLDASLGGPEAAAESAWLYVDLDDATLLELSDTEALESEDWEIAFKRTEIRLNSGDSGPRSLQLASVEGTSWDDAQTPGREAEWTDDDFVSEDCSVETYGRGSIATAFSDWYDYDFATHTASAPEGVVYFVYDPETHAVVKLEIVDYDAGVYELRWAPVEAGA